MKSTVLAAVLVHKDRLFWHTRFHGRWKYSLGVSFAVLVVKMQRLCSRLEGEISDLKSRWECDVAERSRENVARDVELNMLRDTDAKLRAELVQRKHDIDR